MVQSCLLGTVSATTMANLIILLFESLSGGGLLKEYGGFNMNAFGSNDAGRALDEGHMAYRASYSPNNAINIRNRATVSKISQGE